MFNRVSHASTKVGEAQQSNILGKPLSVHILFDVEQPNTAQQPM